MIDLRGNEIEVGDEVVYPATAVGLFSNLKVGVVTYVNKSANKLEIQELNGKGMSSMTYSLARVVVLKKKEVEP